MDLTEVEGLADLIHAETEAQRRQALRQSEGSLAKLYGQWRQSLLQNLAHVEAHIDFDESENIEEDIIQTAHQSLQQVCKEIRDHLSDDRRGEILRSGVHTAIVGAPNAGKSSLLNILCRRPAAIVSPAAGTTRDVLELPVDIGGYPVLLADTAGLRREATDPVEREGVSRAENNAAKADLLLFVVDAPSLIKTSGAKDICSSVCHHFASLGLEAGSNSEKHLVSSKCITILNKVDILQDISSVKHLEEQFINVAGISCKTEDGISKLIERLTAKLSLLCGNPCVGDLPVLTQARHRHHLLACATCLDSFLSYDGDTVLAAHHLRKALRHLGKITGHVSTEQILDVIFKDFCVGK